MFIHLDLFPRPLPVRALARAREHQPIYLCLESSLREVRPEAAWAPLSEPSPQRCMVVVVR